MFIPSTTLTFVMALLAHGAVAFHVEDGTIVYAEHDPVQRVFPVRRPLVKSSITNAQEWIEPGKKTVLRLAPHPPETIVTASIVDELNLPLIEPRRAPHFTAWAGGPVDAAIAFPASETTPTAVAAAAFTVVDSMVPAPTEMIVGPVSGAMVAPMVTPAAVVAPILPRLIPLTTNTVLGPIDPILAAGPPLKEAPAPWLAEQEQEQIAAAGANKLGHRAVPVNEQEDGTLRIAIHKVEPRSVPVAEQADGSLRVAADSLERRHVPVSEQEDGTLRVAVHEPERRNVPVSEQEDGTLRVTADQPARRSWEMVEGEDGFLHYAPENEHRDGGEVLPRCLTSTSAVPPHQTPTAGKTTFATRHRSNSRAHSYSDHSRASHGSHDLRTPTTTINPALKIGDISPFRFPTKPHNLELHPTWATTGTWTTTATYTAITRLDGFIIPRTWTQTLYARDEDHLETASSVTASDTTTGPFAPKVTHPILPLDKRDQDHGPGWQTTSFVTASGTAIGPVAPVITESAPAPAPATATAATTVAMIERDETNDPTAAWPISHRILPSMGGPVATPTGPMAPEMTRPHGRFGRFGDGVIDLMPKKDGEE
jgi:hypothetical protein